MIDPASEYVPAANCTTPAVHAAIAVLIWASVFAGETLAQIVVTCGIPPATPARLQSMRRSAGMIVSVVMPPLLMSTVTATGLDTVEAPSVSYAFAVHECAPPSLAVTAQSYVYGAAPSVARS